MSSILSSPPTPPAALPSDEEIERRIAACPKLASLQSINRELQALVHSDGSVISQIADVIRHDPSLAARLLRMINSVYFGLSTRVNNLDEAVFFLGLRQVRELALATPVLEELQQLQAGRPLPWKELWTHSIATAIITREILGATALRIDDETDYLVGLLHNIGKVIMAYAFPDALQAVMAEPSATPVEVCLREREYVGWDHGRIGAHYLAHHHLAEEIVFAVQYHHCPEAAPHHQLFAAAVQIADAVARHAGVSGGFERVDPIDAEAWTALSGWNILFGGDPTEALLAQAAISNSLQRLPSMLAGLG